MNKCSSRILHHCHQVPRAIVSGEIPRQDQVAHDIAAPDATTIIVTHGSGSRSCSGKCDRRYGNYELLGARRPDSSKRWRRTASYPASQRLRRLPEGDRYVPLSSLIHGLQLAGLDDSVDYCQRDSDAAPGES